MKNWKVTEYNHFVEVIPLDDLAIHVHDNCPCDPRITIDDEINKPIIIHYSFDGREGYEINDTRGIT